MSQAATAKTAPPDPEVTRRLGEVYAEIVSRAPEHDFDPTLDRIKSVLDLLGDPQRAFRIVHVTGTNGKTSTARMIEALVREHGLRTGLFTSPHLHSITERIQIDGEPISPERFVEVYEDVLPYVKLVEAGQARAQVASDDVGVDTTADDGAQASGGLDTTADVSPPARTNSKLSFFEVLTAMAYAAFADAPVDVAVVEVGMGGTWDSTNVANGEVAVITPIAMDHQRWLGDTLNEIADNKAGIIKPATALASGAGAVVVSAKQREVPAEIIAARAREVGATLLVEDADLAVVDRQVAVGGQLLTLRTPRATYADIFLPLHGEHQAHNAVLALAATEALLGTGALGGQVVEDAFAHVSSPGRLELARSSPTILLDAAHNPHGAQALTEAVEESFGLANLVGVVAVLNDKDAEGFFAALEPALSAVVLTRNTSPRCADPLDLRDIAEDVFGPDRVIIEPDMPEAIQIATNLAERDDQVGVGAGSGVLITGSVSTVADARRLLRRD